MRDTLKRNINHLKKQSIMNKLHLLGANKSYDRDEQTISVNQVVVLEGYNYDSYVMYEVTRNK